MRVRRATSVLFAAVLVLTLFGSANARRAVTCSAAEKSAAQQALATVVRAMPKQRAAYFRTHKKASVRAAFVKKQQARLRKLKAAAACTLDATAPSLGSVSVSGKVLKLTFSEPVAGVVAASFTVSVNGSPDTVTEAAASGAEVTLSLAKAVWSGDAVVFSAAVGAVADAAGNQSAAVPNMPVTNLSGTLFAPELAKADWADDRAPFSPDYGEWPIDHRYHLSSTRVREIMLFVDFPNAPATLAPRTVYSTWAPVASEWFRNASFGRFDFGIDYVDRVYRLSKPSAEYGVLTNRGRTTVRDIVAEAARLADADVDFTKYDAIWVVGSSHDFGVAQMRMWPGEGFTVDGKEFLHGEVVDAVVLNGGGGDELGHPVTDAGLAHQAVTHETLHHMGIPDTSYKPDASTPYDFSYVGGWDMQDSPAGMLHGADDFAWNKWRLGWIDVDQVRGVVQPGSSVETTVTPVEVRGDLKMIVVQMSPTFLYAVEVRRHLGNDAKSTCDDGVLVYTVDSTKRNGQAPVTVKAAQPSTDPSRISTCGLKYAAPFDVGPGEVSTFEDANVKVEVLSTDGTSYRVRVTRK